MALTTQELNTIYWKWSALGNEWGFDPRMESFSHPDEKAAKDSLGALEIDTIVLEHKWKVIRKQRDDLLIASDWTQGADVPLTIKSPWSTYRALLRDIPTQSDPDNINWPTKPS